MKASKEITKKNNKKGVSFDALEAIDRLVIVWTSWHPW